MNLIDGKTIGKELKEELKKEVAGLKAKGINPGLATIWVGENPASKAYIGSKIKACEELGITSFHNHLPETASENEVAQLINKLNDDKNVHGILLQLPIPKHLNADKLIDLIAPDKDVDGLTTASIGKLGSVKSWEEIEKNKLMVPCTPLGIIYLLKKMKIEISGKNAVVIGRSNLVGKPIAMLLLYCNATVTIAHSKTKDLPDVCKKADILIAAIGKEKMVKADYVKKGAVVIDVGINRTAAGLCGDVDFESVKDIAGLITPVPGGVGQMTVVMLMKNTILASQK